jgi:hypothetical protein
MMCMSLTMNRNLVMNKTLEVVAIQIVDQRKAAEVRV